MHEGSSHIEIQIFKMKKLNSSSLVLSSVSGSLQLYVLVRTWKFSRPSQSRLKWWGGTECGVRVKVQVAYHEDDCKL